MNCGLAINSVFSPNLPVNNPEKFLMPEIILIRHGETFFNTLGKLQGQSNSPLSKLGVLQSQAVAARFTYTKPDLIISSDLGRATQTAQIISEKLNLHYCTEEAFRESKFGDFEGLSWLEIESRYGKKIVQQLKSRHMDIAPPKGESYRDSLYRMINRMNELKSQKQFSKILIVTHGLLIVNFIYWILSIQEKTPPNIHIGNTSVTSLTFQKNIWYLNTIGDTSHLKSASTI